MHHDIELFPYLLMRVSGGPFEQFQKLNLSGTMDVMEAIHDNHGLIKKQKENISGELHRLIASIREKDPKISDRVLKFRRDIYNDRNTSAATEELLDPVLPDSIKVELDALRQLRKKSEELDQQGRLFFNEELKRSRKNLRELAQDQNLQKGLLLSSQSLLARINSYLKRDGALRKKELQTERSLIKYLARMYAKTSPFSTFTSLALATVTHDDAAPFGVNDNSEPEIRCHIRLNNFLYQYLKGLLLAHPDIARAVPIRPNPTLRQADDHYVYLTNSQNIEAFQRIPANPVLEVFQTLSSQKPQGLSVNHIVREILENEYIDATAQEIESYIKQLVQFGFLEYNFGVSGIDPDWDIRLREILLSLQEGIPLLKQLTGSLEKVRELAAAYESASLDSRRDILRNAFSLFRDTCMMIHEAAGLPEEERLTPEERQRLDEEKEAATKEKEEENDDEAFVHRSSTVFNFKPEQMFYEDTTFSVDGIVSGGHYKDFISTLHTLLQNLKHFEAHHDEQAKMLHYFQGKYMNAGDNGVDLLAFYEDFYREFKKPAAKLAEDRKKRQMEGPQQGAPAPEEADEQFEVPAVKEKAGVINRWQEYLAAHFKEKFSSTIAEGEEVRVDIEDVVKANQEASVTMPHWDGHRSYGGFMQFFVQEGDDGDQCLMGVANGTFPGCGKMFSRFLHILNPKVTEALRQHNLSLSNGNLFIEDTDASYFNANLHPPLMPYEIWMPNGHNTLPPERQIPITELTVKSDPKAGRLQLHHVPSGKNAFVFDLGFQGHRGRSQLFQLLEKFTLAPALFAVPVSSSINKAVQAIQDSDENRKKKAITVRPRVVYENTIVLQRKLWEVPHDLLPLKQPGEDDWDYFRRVNIWRKEMGMPGEIFLYLVDRRQMERVTPDQKTKFGRDDYKPQYICFDNPFLVNLFEKALLKAPGTIKIEEMLPDSRQLLQLGKNRHITEFVVQWCTRDNI